jgi:hypothetical protein
MGHVATSLRVFLLALVTAMLVWQFFLDRDLLRDIENVVTAVVTSGQPVEGTVQPCPTEDSSNCYWDADKMGNGTGHSFTVDGHGNYTYWED